MISEETKQKIDSIFSRGIGEFIDPDGAFRKKLEIDPQKIVIKLGVDPNRPDIHLGHAVILQKLRQFQDLGCKVIFLIGDYTAQIGDPTGKNKARLEIEQKEVEKNMETYLKQVNLILKKDPAVFSWIRNSDWFTSITDIQANPGMKVSFSRGNRMMGVFSGNSFIGKTILFEKTRMQLTHLKNKNIHAVSLSFVLNTLRRITHSRLIERDMFQERIKNREELYMHEMLYPVLQGLDSHILAKVYGSCDLEVGGTDQHFNMLMGRQIMSMYSQTPQAVASFKLLEGLDGSEKMSKSLDNYVGITEDPREMYGKLMSLPDSSIVNYYELCTFTPVAEVVKIKEDLAGNKINPKDAKMALAKQIVSIYHGEKKAEEAEGDWVSKFEKKEIPKDVKEVFNMDRPVDVLVSNKLTSSVTSARRLFEDGAVTDLSTDTKLKLEDKFESGHIYKIGKHNFIKIK